MHTIIYLAHDVCMIIHGVIYVTHNQDAFKWAITGLATRHFEQHMCESCSYCENKPQLGYSHSNSVTTGVVSMVSSYCVRNKIIPGR